MIFQHVDKVLSGEQTQTRRIVKSEHCMAGALPHFVPYVYVRVGIAGSRDVYRVGKTYAIQPGRGQKAVGRIEITAIRREDVRFISHADAIDEGLNSPFVFLRTWVAMHDKPADTAWFKYSFTDGDESGITSDTAGWMSWLKVLRPADRYQAWVLEFRLVEPAP